MLGTVKNQWDKVSQLRILYARAEQAYDLVVIHSLLGNSEQCLAGAALKVHLAWKNRYISSQWSS